MRGTIRLSSLAVLCLAASWAQAGGSKDCQKLERINQCLGGKVIDYTHNHGVDRRIWSAALQEWRDLYVYVPPGFDPRQCYPVFLYLHGFAQDETYFLENQLHLFDEAIVAGKLPSVIIAWPDGSILGRASYFKSASFFANSNAGNLEDYLMQDVWPFLLEHYPIRPEREAHVVIGASMGGSAAFRLAMTYPQCFKVAVGFFPALNLRWVDCHGHYRGNFDPCCWGWRTRLKPHEVIGRFYGVVIIPFKVMITPVFGRGADALSRLSGINPIELLDRLNVQPGEPEMYIAYGGRDQFNIDAEVESFLYKARQRGLTIGVGYDPKGRHDLATGTRLFRDAVAWVAPLIAPYSPKCPLHPCRLGKELPE